MAANRDGWVDPTWWQQQVETVAHPVVLRRCLVALAVVGWIILYPLLIAEAVVYPGQLILVAIAMILTSEGFATTSIALSRWAGNLGIAYYKATKTVIGQQASSDGAPGYLGDRLGEIADRFEACLEKGYGGVFSRVRPGSDCSLQALCAVLAAACRTTP